jgi:hypothetical protein
MARRTIARYAVLAYVLVMVQISAPVRMRFPTLDYLVASGMDEGERTNYAIYLPIYPPYLIHLIWLFTTFMML